MEKSEILITVAFGTTDASEFNKCFLPVFRRSQQKSEMPAVFSLSSQKVRDLFIDYLSFEDAIKYALNKGFTDVNIFAIYLAEGKEYSKVKSVIDKYKDNFNSIKVNKPFLSDMPDEFAEYYNKTYPLNSSLKLLLGHGTGKETDKVYSEVNNYLSQYGRNDFNIVLAHDENLLIKEKLKQYKSVEVIPLMFSKGHHIQEMYCDIKQLCDEQNIACTLADGLGADENFRNLITERYIK